MYSHESVFQTLKRCDISEKTLYTWHFLFTNLLQPLKEQLVFWPDLKQQFLHEAQSAEVL